MRVIKALIDCFFPVKFVGKINFTLQTNSRKSKDSPVGKYVYQYEIKSFTLILYIISDKYKMEFKNMLGLAGGQQNQSCFPKLSWNQRLIGFGICCVLGYVIQFLSFGAFISVVTGNPAKFAIVYSFGNVLALAATGFLIGFRRQCINMADKDRRITSILFIGALLGTLFAALVLNSKILVIICLCVQIPAYIWYVATYIPFARDCIKSCLKGCLNKLKK